MKKLITWLKQSNRSKHLIGGYIIGVFSDSDYCAAYAGIGIAGALEFKDKEHGDVWDWIDFSITCVGVLIGRLTTRMLA